MAAPRTLVIACGALARELLEICRLNGLHDVTVECLPAALHNRPKEIPDAVRARIHRARDSQRLMTASAGERGVAAIDDTTSTHDPVDDPSVLGESGEFGDPTAVYDSIFVAYADCGTGGLLQRVCAEEGVEMLAGAHCYQFFATGERFIEIQDSEIGSFYLTDFLVRHFDRMVWQGLGLDRHPELLEMYFGNYTRVVYLAQTDDEALLAGAAAAAQRLGLTMIVERTGYGELEPALVELKRDPR